MLDKVWRSFHARQPHNNLYMNRLMLRMVPCCYLTKTPEHDEIRLSDFPDINATAMRALRRRPDKGPLYGACERCPISW